MEDPRLAAELLPLYIRRDEVLKEQESTLLARLDFVRQCLKFNSRIMQATQDMIDLGHAAPGSKDSFTAAGFSFTEHGAWDHVSETGADTGGFTHQAADGPFVSPISSDVLADHPALSTLRSPRKRQILQILGLNPERWWRAAQLAAALHEDKVRSVRNTLLEMVRVGLIERDGEGQYRYRRPGAQPSSRPTRQPRSQSVSRAEFLSDQPESAEAQAPSGPGATRLTAVRTLTQDHLGGQEGEVTENEVTGVGGRPAAGSRFQHLGVRSAEVLEALEACQDGWLTTRELAEALGQITEEEMHRLRSRLSVLVGKGLIDKHLMSNPRRCRYRLAERELKEATG